MIDPTNYIKDTNREFSLYTAQNRAIPSVCDGMKDGQRKVFWVLKSKTDKIKTISLAGALIESNLYNHGDASAADTISNLAGHYVNNVPLIGGIGNFGTKVTPSEFGAPRYTYVKKNKATTNIVYSDLDIIPLKENYDGSAMEPENFLPIIPLVLLNGISGIAVGWSTDILPRRLSDIIDSTIKVLDGKKIQPIQPYYSYANCTVTNLGDNSWEFDGKVEILDTTTVRITELPPGLGMDKIRSTLNNLEDNGTIQSYSDRTTKEIDITVKFTRSDLKNYTEAKLISLFKLKKKQSERIVVLDFNNKSIKQYNSDVDLIKDFVSWRTKWYRTRYENLKSIDSDELKYWLGLKECFDKNLPSKLSKIKSKSDLEAEVAKITKNIKLENKHIDRIVNISSYRWVIEYYATIEENIKNLNDRIKTYEDILSDEKNLKDVYKKELLELKKNF